MPLGNLTSQFFGNVYLDELDYFIKHKLRAKYYIRYVDDFVILNESKDELEQWLKEIDSFLRLDLKLELHPQKSKIHSLSNKIDFIGFRNFYNFKLLRKRNIRKMRHKIKLFEQQKISYGYIMQSFQGWQAYAKWANTYKIRKEFVKEIYKIRKSQTITENIDNYFI